MVQTKHTIANLPLRFLLLTLLVLITAFTTSASEYVLTVADFEVQTSNAKYMYVGKGISAILANELRQSKAIDLVEREKLNEIFKENELTLSGVTQGDVQIGQILDVDLIVVGEIVDMGNTFLVDVRVLDAETAAIVWSDSITEKLRRYDYIGAYFAEGILTELEVDISEKIVTKVEEIEDKDEDALVAMSAGIDAYDQGDVEEAKEQLSEAKRLDPTNEVAKEYLSRLSTISPRYRVDLFEYINPATAASLPFNNSVRIHTWLGVNYDPPWVDGDNDGYQVVNGYGVGDQSIPFYSGVTLPLGKKFGIGVSFYYLYLDLELRKTSDPTWFKYKGNQSGVLQNPLHSMGGIFSIGYKIMSSLSIGASVTLGSNENFQNKGLSDVLGSGGDITEEGFLWGLNPNIIWIPQGRKIILSSDLGYNSQAIYYANPDTGIVSKGVQPLVWSTSFAYGPLWNRLFLSLTTAFDIFIDARRGHGLSIIPMVEYWPWGWLSLRAGYEYTHLIQNDTFVIGNGFVVGSTLNLGIFELNLNFASRNKPIQLLPGSLMSNIVFVAGIEVDTRLLKRK